LVAVGSVEKLNAVVGIWAKLVIAGLLARRCGVV
jgi:hypothetical protein